MSRLFGISTDYLLKDELERPEKIDGPTTPPQPIPSDEVPSDPRPLRRASRELAEEYLDRRQRCAPRIALATFLCILSPIPLLLLTGMSQDTRFAITEEARRRNRTVRSAGGRGRGAVPVLRRKEVRLSGEGAAGGAAGAELGHLDGGRCVVRRRDDGDAAADPKKIPPQGALAKRPGGL